MQYPGSGLSGALPGGTLSAPSVAGIGAGAALPLPARLNPGTMR